MARFTNILVLSSDDDKYQSLRVAFSYVFCAVSFFVFVSYTISTILYASQESNEFMECLVIELVILQVLFQFSFVFKDPYKLVRIVNGIKRKFSTVDLDIVESCKKAEIEWYWLFTAIVFLDFGFCVVQTHLLHSKEYAIRRTEIYGYKNPDNIVGFALYFPSFMHIDLSQPPFYQIYTVGSLVYVVCLGSAGGLTYTLMGIFCVHLSGQMRLLIKYIKMIDHYERTADGSVKYYTNIVTGQYFIWNKSQPTRITLHTMVKNSKHLKEFDETQFKTKVGIIQKIIAYNQLSDDLGSNGKRGRRLKDVVGEIMKARVNAVHVKAKDYNPIYEEFFIKQIIQYHQFLLSTRAQIETYMSPVVIPTCLGFILIAAFDIQIFLNYTSHVTFALSVLGLTLHVYKLVDYSDQVNTYHEEIRSLIYAESEWYLKSRRFRRMVNYILMRTNKPEHFSFNGGFVTYNKPFLLSLFIYTYKFFNWLLYVNQRK
ncbi:hypothetical protein M8J76_000533 [Diaphorina citri]|nr:hypothetical protein M8J76_000533 [Diaphorina citri]